MTRMLMLLPLALLAACGGDEQAQVDFSGEEVGEDRHSVLSRDGEVKMGLTDRYVYFSLSDDARAQARAEVEQDLGEGEGIGGMVGGVLQKGLEKALTFRAKYPVEEIEDIHWSGGEMRIEFADGDRRIADMMKVDDRPVTEAFSRAAVEEFAEAFRRVKAEQQER